MSDNPSVVLRGTNKIVFEQRPVPQIKDPHYVKIAIKQTGICGSDYAYYSTGRCGSFVVSDPLVLGHESSGVIVEVGSEVKHLKIGDRVACEPGIPSRYSHEYKSGNYNLCPYMAFAATPPYDGTLCRYYLLPEDFCIKLPPNMSLEEGAVVEPTSVAVHANRRAGVTFGDRVVVMGAGPVGLLISGVARAFGATHVMIMDLAQNRLDFAVSNGYATECYNSRGKSLQDIKDYVLEKWGGNLPNVSFDATGAPACICIAISLLSKGGRHVQVGNGRDTLDGFPVAKMAENELTIRGCFRYSVDNYSTSVELISSGKLDVKPLITHRFKFNQAIDAYKFFKKGKAIKIMISGPETTDKCKL